MLWYNNSCHQWSNEWDWYWNIISKMKNYAYNTEMGLRKNQIKLSVLPQHTHSVPSISHALYWIPHLRNEAQYGLHNHIAFPKSHTRQIDIIRPRPRVIFLSKYLTRLPCPDSHLVCVIKRNKSPTYPPLYQLLYEKRRLWGTRYRCVCMYERASEGGGAGHGSLQSKPLPHGPQTMS